MKKNVIIRTALLLCSLAGTSALAQPPHLEALRTIRLNDQVEGELATNDVENSVLPGRFADDFRYVGDFGDDIWVFLKTPTFGGKVQILDNRGTVVAESDSEEGPRHALWLIFTPVEGMQYAIRVTSEAPWATGRYTLGTLSATNP